MPAAFHGKADSTASSGTLENSVRPFSIPGFHEGMDIRPLHRDPNGEPLDVIHAIAAGKVVYANDVPSYSNYGRYIVIEHQFGGCPYYSLYAHLSAVEVNIGDQVSQGDPIAVMGHTGEGLDRDRSHVHLDRYSDSF
jgi:murein DD-endopeptidase MepM/ murein hydrolase activator NlpD